jgi:hypothetical protein
MIKKGVPLENDLLFNNRHFKNHAEGTARRPYYSIWGEIGRHERIPVDILLKTRYI